RGVRQWPSRTGAVLFGSFHPGTPSLSSAKAGGPLPWSSLNARGRCDECRQKRPLTSRHPHDKSRGWICARCRRNLTKQVGESPKRGKRALRSNPQPIHPIGQCSECWPKCHREKPLTHPHPIDSQKGRVCRSCRRRLTASGGPCPECWPKCQRQKML